jgi:hypothetical protein
VSKAGALRNVEINVADFIIGRVEAVFSAVEELNADYEGDNIDELIDGSALAESEDLEATRKKATMEGNHLAAKQTQAKIDAWLDESAALRRTHRDLHRTSTRTRRTRRWNRESI